MIQYRRRFNGNYNFNFISAFEGAVDFSNKNYSNFYLTRKSTLDSYIEYSQASTSKTTSLFTPLKVGEEYIRITDIDITPYKENDRYSEVFDYGAVELSDTYDNLSGLFEISLLDNEYCTISHTIDGITFYLAGDITTGSMFFVRDRIVDTEAETNSGTNFRIQLDLDFNLIYLTLPTWEGSRYIVKDGNTIVAREISNDKYDVLSSAIGVEIASSIDVEPIINTSFITYDSDGTSIDIEKSAFGLESNYLFHKSGDLRTNTFDFLNLKNITNSLGTYTSNNNLIESIDGGIYASDNRNYTSINNDINQSADEGLELSYVFANQDILIDLPAVEFTTGDSLAPFDQININDTKLIESGAFSFTTPELADRIYMYSDNSIIEGGSYLCTWLSGGLYSDEKIWVDRYYYPDRVSKMEALSSADNPINPHNYIESLISANSSIEDNVNTKKIFDKRSDLVFKPNTTYRYERSYIENLESTTTAVNYCDVYGNSDDSSIDMLFNYYKDINESGQITLGFKFDGNDNDFTVRSSRNKIDGGIEISKNGKYVNLTFKLFEPSTQSIDEYSYSFKYNKSRSTDVIFHYNSYTGIGALFVDSAAEYVFQTLVFGSVNDKILFGDINVSHGDIKENILTYNSLGHNNIYDAYVSADYFTNADLLELIFVRSNFSLEPLTISIPSGMRNDTDNISLLNSICFNQRSKSNAININVKNIGDVSDDIKDSIKNNIINELTEWLPVNTSINKFSFTNFK